MSEDKSDYLEDALLALEIAKAASQLSPELQERIDAMSSFRSAVKGAVCEGEPKAPAIIIPATRDVQRMAEILLLEDKYSEATETQKVFELLKPGQQIPDYGQVLRTFSPYMLQTALEFKKPKLVLPTQGRSFSELMDSIRSHRVIDELIKISTLEPYHSGLNVAPFQWGAFIVEGLEFPGGLDSDHLNLPLNRRLKAFDEYRERQGLDGMDRWKYIHLAMQALRNKSPIDAESWTLLDQDPILMKGMFPHASWSANARRMEFGWFHAGFRDQAVRFRRVVGGKIIG
jgi:hypothetical protein